MRKVNKMLICLLCAIMLHGSIELVNAQQDAYVTPVKVEDEVMLPDSPGNDKVYLINGRVLRQVRILRETNSHVVVKVWEGVDPLFIVRKQVEHVEYAPVKNDMNAQNDIDNSPRVIEGAELSTTFHAKLTSPLSGTHILFEKNDFIEVLKLLGQEADIVLEIESKVEDIPLDERLWTVEIASNASFDMILQENLLVDFPFLEIRYEYDRIRLSIKQE